MKRGIDFRAVKRAASIVSVALRYQLPLKRAGRERWRSLCPFHAEKTPSFYLDERRQNWVCFGCGERGDVIDLVARIERLQIVAACAKLGTMEIEAAPFSLWEPPKKAYVIPCTGRGCTRRIDADVDELPYLGRQLHAAWRIVRLSDDIEATCPSCARKS